MEHQEQDEEDHPEGAAAVPVHLDDSDIEISLTFPFEEVAGKKKGSRGFLCTPHDNHLYRINKALSDTTNFLYCYHSRPTKDSNVSQKCLATGIMDVTNKR